MSLLATLVPTIQEKGAIPIVRAATFNFPSLKHVYLVLSSSPPLRLSLGKYSLFKFIIKNALLIEIVVYVITTIITNYDPA